ncbi:MAG TPA: ribonuclease III domain-containing protein [Thermoclostridium sp.]|nr:ribonuclease III domain-containing protein [Thermoclostridium sp.]
MENGKLDNMQVNQLSPLVLAFVGDAVFDLFVRSRLTMKKRESAHKLHVGTTKYVKAAAQSRISKELHDKFTDEEKAIFRRGRNSKSATIPKHADVLDYRRSTAFEAVLGYLYLLGRQERLLEILNMAVKVIEEGEGSNGQ